MLKSSIVFIAVFGLMLITLGCENTKPTTPLVKPNIYGAWASDSLGYYIAFNYPVNPGDPNTYVSFDLDDVLDTGTYHTAEKGTWTIQKSIDGGGTWDLSLNDELILIPETCDSITIDSSHVDIECDPPYGLKVSLSRDGGSIILTRGNEHWQLPRAQ